MPDKKRIKLSQDISKKEEENKNNPFTFGFKYFKPQSSRSTAETFNNNYASEIQFLKTNSDFMEAVKIISNETYNTAIVGKKLEDSMHFKLLENDEAEIRINIILTKVYSDGQKVVENLLEGSSYIEFGMTKGCRYIGVLIDFHIIELLYFDPQHLTFPNAKFDIPQKMSYTTPPLFGLKSDNVINSKTSSLQNELNISELLSKQIIEQKEKEMLEYFLMGLDDFDVGNKTAEEVLETLKTIKEEIYD